jgi:hypothetical protein
MGAKFYFFTDPALLDPQAASQAYGPAGTLGSKDRFRVTDLHQRKAGSTADVPAFAICDGLLCAQADAGGTLSLILKPIEQPPFDFPFVSYIIYKGIDPTSLLQSGNAGAGGTIDTTKAAGNKLVDSVQKTWEANSNSGDPTRECLGLHLTPASTATDYPDLDLSKFAATAPLDNLFYQGDPKFQLPLVRGGWRIGDFASAGFGLEIVVERIGYRPKIALARKPENVIEVTSLDPTVTHAPNDATYFMHWHDKEECLNFIDPCAFWGSFFANTLRVRKPAEDEFGRKSGAEIYDILLRGAYDDSNPTAGNFYNRNRAQIDVRNEHGQSLNYYKNYGTDIRLTLNKNANIATEIKSYYGTGWPYLTIAKLDYPAGSGADAEVYFALPVGDNAKPLLFLSAGRAKKKGLFSRPIKFLERNPDVATGYMEKASMQVALYDDGQSAKTVSSYSKLCYFKLGTAADGTAQPSAGSTAPARQETLDFLLRLPSDPALVSTLAGRAVCFFNDEILVDRSSGGASEFHVAVPSYAGDASNTYISLLPWFSYEGGRSERVSEHFSKGFFLEAAGPPFLQQVAKRYSLDVAKRMIDVDGTEANKVSVYFYTSGLLKSFRFSSGPVARMPVLILAGSELSQILATFATKQPIDGTGFATFTGFGQVKADFAQVPYVSPTMQAVCLAPDNSGHIAWSTNQLGIALYAHDNN